jgi:hypothetical protein
MIGFAGIHRKDSPVVGGPFFSSKTWGYNHPIFLRYIPIIRNNYPIYPIFLRYPIYPIIKTWG